MNFAQNRYDTMPYNRVRKSGLKLPAIYLGMWHNFGAKDSETNQLKLLQTAFDLGITHFDSADNYGGGHAEINVGRFLKQQFKQHRDELIISTKAGHPMRDRKQFNFFYSNNLKQEIDQSMKRLQLDYVDTFYHHRPDSETPADCVLDRMHAKILPLPHT
jgi:L-glyceraldehyde 3-phosphate reductase